MKIEDVVNRFNTTPFLFVGSGITRRYLNLPDWKGLLEHFAKIVYDDEFSYSAYENRAKNLDCRAGLLPKVAELIQLDFDRKWFAEPNIRTVDIGFINLIKDGLSPFKAEVATYIKGFKVINEKYENEINKLIELSIKSIAGVITTNYDSFLEDHFQDYSKYVGQTELIFSAIQGIGEIYKIHGSVEFPDSMVLNENDYLEFDKKSSYLAAKLMTIFIEYPIIFLGYSISDSNIQKIIKAIVGCLDNEQIKKLEDRFVFIEHKRGMVGVEVTPCTIMIDDKPLIMRKIILEDFLILYEALGNKKAKLPVKILRRFKQELYNYTITNMPTANLRVASLDDMRVDDDELVLAIGKVSELGLRGLSGLESNEWYRNIILNDLEFSADELLEYAYPKLLKQNSGRIPIHKYLKLATKPFPDCVDHAKTQVFDKIISNTFKKDRKYLGEYQSVKQIWNNEKNSLEKATRLISYLPEEQISVDELEVVLKELFEEDVNILQNTDPNIRTNIRRLVRIYDYLKWGK